MRQSCYLLVMLSLQVVTPASKPVSRDATVRPNIMKNDRLQALFWKKRGRCKRSKDSQEASFRPPAGTPVFFVLGRSTRNNQGLGRRHADKMFGPILELKKWENFGPGHVRSTRKNQGFGRLQAAEIFFGPILEEKMGKFWSWTRKKD